jgi:hypothetical protein
MSKEQGPSDIRLAASKVQPDKFRSVLDLAVQVAHDESLREEIVRDPVKALLRHGEPPGEERKLITIILGLFAAGVLVAITVFAAQGGKAQTELIALGSAALGGLVGTQARR